MSWSTRDTGEMMPITKVLVNEREDLPIPVRDEVWDLFLEVRAITPVVFIFDPTRRNGAAQEGVFAEAFHKPETSEVGINIFVHNVTEGILAHEIIHLLMIVRGEPYLIPDDDDGTPDWLGPVLNLITNSVQHIKILRFCEKIGLDHPDLREMWFSEMRDVNRQVSAHDEPEQYLRLYGSYKTFRGLVSDIPGEEIFQCLHPALRSGFDDGLRAYQEISTIDVYDREFNFKALLCVGRIFKLSTFHALLESTNFILGEQKRYDPGTGKLVHTSFLTGFLRR